MGEDLYQLYLRQRINNKKIQEAKKYYTPKNQ
jgi:hypothetical protein